MNKEQNQQQTQLQKEIQTEKLSVEDLLKKYSNLTVLEAMDMGYSYEEIIFGQ